MVFGSRTASSAVFSGSSSFAVVGVVYYPNTALSWSGSTASTSSGCMELIAKTINLTGSSEFAATCTSFGAASLTTGTPAYAKLMR